MRTSDRLPEECREELRARIERYQEEFWAFTNPITRSEELAWVLGEGEGGKD
jgi:hypothetical protein